MALLTSCTSADGTATYSYDPTGQLLAATYSGGQSSESYTYDANGNRVTADGCVYATGADNELLSDGTYRYAYDAEGNRTAKFIDANADGILDAGDTDVTQFKWDARNRLVEVPARAAFGGVPTEVVDYLYDVENRWIGENIDSNGDGQIDHKIRFAYDGDQIVLQFDKDVSSSQSGGGTAVTGADLSHRYLWQPGAVDQLMADEQLSAASGGGYDQSQPGNVVWPLADNLGTIRDLAVCESGVTSVANHRVYDSYGKLQSQTNAAVDCLFGFTGRPLDKATGLQNNLERWYDAKTGGWMSKDPIGSYGGDTNTSRYCGNSPTNATDPTGLADGWTSLWGWNPWSWGSTPVVTPGWWVSWATGYNAEINHGQALDAQRRARDPNRTLTPGDYPTAYNGMSQNAAAGYALEAIKNRIDDTAADATLAIAAAGVEHFAVVSRISESPRLVRNAEAAGKASQGSLDNLVAQLARGNLNPGIGTKALGNGIFEARARDGARVYFRIVKGTIEILGKSTKANQEAVIQEIMRTFGH